MQISDWKLPNYGREKDDAGQGIEKREMREKKKKKKGTDVVMMSSAAELEGLNRWCECETFRNTLLSSCYA